MIDTHVHVWDETCSMLSGTGYLPSRQAAPLDEILRLWDQHGIEGGVLVQPSFLGSDNSFLLRMLARQPDRLRGIIIADPAEHAGQATALHAAGVRGFRFNLISGGPLPDLAEPAWRRMLAAARQLGWHLVLAAPAATLAEIVPSLRKFGLPIVIDHCGLPSTSSGDGCPSWRAIWTDPDDTGPFVKLSASYRIAGGGDRLMLAKRLREWAGAERLLWGSDWPWTRYEEGRSFAAEMAESWFAGDTALAAPCRTNAARLYGFATT